MTYYCKPVETNYFKANEGYSRLIDVLINNCSEGDYIYINETPISTIEGNLIDESEINSGITSFLITELWCRYLWGYFLCPLLGYNERTIKNLRQMPKEARKHKEFILKRYGLKHALQPTAEAGVDLSNVPGNFVSLLPENPEKSASKIKNMIKKQSNKDVEIIIIDTDPTYKFRNIYFTTLPQSIKGIKNDTGIFGYVLRAFTKKVGATPLATTIDMDIEELINMANIVEECQKNNSTNFFETIYNMQEKFNVKYDEITVEMLDSVKHIPAVILHK
ncbi:MAG: gamma-glutamyl ligase [Methanosphaera stadtmanae]|nr:gamma-glutamyl ligase [Methanosphaera stadtmanae]